VAGRNPAPVHRCFIPLFIGFLPSQVVQDFFHPQYIYNIINPFVKLEVCSPTERFSEELGTTWHHLIVIDGIVTWMFIYTFFEIATILISIGVAF